MTVIHRIAETNAPNQRGARPSSFSVHYQGRQPAGERPIIRYSTLSFGIGEPSGDRRMIMRGIEAPRCLAAAGRAEVLGLPTGFGARPIPGIAIRLASCRRSASRLLDGRRGSNLGSVHGRSRGARPSRRLQMVPFSTQHLKDIFVYRKDERHGDRNAGTIRGADCGVGR